MIMADPFKQLSSRIKSLESQLAAADELAARINDGSFTHSEECDSQDYLNEPYCCICGFDELIRDWIKYKTLRAKASREGRG